MFSKHGSPIRRVLAAYVAPVLLVALSTGCAPYQETWTRPDLVEASAAARYTELRAVSHRVILFGDGGASDVDPSNPARLIDPTLVALAQRAAEIPDRTTVAVLGDTVYPKGVPPAGEKHAAARKKADDALTAQLAAITSAGARAVLVAGNHDWKYGLEGVGRQADMARQYPTGARADVRFAPKPGLPGPTIIDISPGVRLIALDTEWWIRGLQETGDDERIRAEIAAAVGGAGGRRCLVIAHHPIVSHGPHGGVYDMRTRFGTPVPAPIVGGLVGAAIGGALSLAKGEFWPLPFALCGGALAVYMPTHASYSVLHGIASRGQDIHTPPYQRMLATFRAAFAESKPFVYASGHEHILEALDGGDMADYLLVSGAGSKKSPFRHGAGTLYGTYGEGFMLLDFLRDGSVELRVITTDSAPEAGSAAFSMLLDD